MSGQSDRQTPIRIALTGGIGSGKSTALLMFAARGAAVLNSDSVVHDLLERPEVRAQVAENLGMGPIPSGEKGRGLISEIVFARHEQLKRLEQILFPLVRKEIEVWLATDEVRSAPMAVIELPMLFEAGMEKDFDRIVLVTAPEDVRMTRHEGRMGLADFERRASRQLPESEKRKRSDYVYDNIRSPEELDEFISATVAAIADEAAVSRKEP